MRLKIVEDGVILRSQANLVAARAANWGEAERETARRILDRIAAQARARAYREVRTRFKDCNDALLAEAKQRFGVVAPFGGPTSSGMLTLHCPPDAVHDLASFMRERGAESITVAEIEYVFAPDNPLYAKLAAGLGGSALAIVSHPSGRMAHDPNTVCDLLDIEHPIALGGMGSATSPALVAAVSRAGGLGALGCHYLTPEQIQERTGGIRRETNKPFGLELPAVRYPRGQPCRGARASPGGHAVRLGAARPGPEALFRPRA